MFGVNDHCYLALAGQGQVSGICASFFAVLILEDAAAICGSGSFTLRTLHSLAFGWLVGICGWGGGGGWP